MLHQLLTRTKMLPPSKNATIRMLLLLRLQVFLTGQQLSGLVTAFQSPSAWHQTPWASTTHSWTPPGPLSSTKLFRQKSKWDDLEDEDDEDEDPILAAHDMKYIPRNVQRQHFNFNAIYQIGGKELTSDVYVPEPDGSETFWFVGKVARTSDVSVEQAVARQWPLICEHAALLRPQELWPSRANLDAWIAPGDSEIEVAYNRPDVVFTKMSKDVDGASEIKHNLIGFQGERYEQGEGMGFRTHRTPDGKPAKPEIQTPEAPAMTNEEDDNEEENAFSKKQFRSPTDEELKKSQDTLKDKNMNIEELYEEQQKREGTLDQ